MRLTVAGELPIMTFSNAASCLQLVDHSTRLGMEQKRLT